MRYKEYIPSLCLRRWNVYMQNPNDYKIIEKFPIQKIRRKKLRNEVRTDDVLYMLTNFDQEVWDPVMIDHKNYLVDGQHRLAVAAQFGIRYIDVVMRLN